MIRRDSQNPDADTERLVPISYQKRVERLTRKGRSLQRNALS